MRTLAWLGLTRAWAWCAASRSTSKRIITRPLWTGPAWGRACSIAASADGARRFSTRSRAPLTGRPEVFRWRALPAVGGEAGRLAWPESPVPAAAVPGIAGRGTAVGGLAWDQPDPCRPGPRRTALRKLARPRRDLDQRRYRRRFRPVQGKPSASPITWPAWSTMGWQGGTHVIRGEDLREAIRTSTRLLQVLLWLPPAPFRLPPPSLPAARPGRQAAGQARQGRDPAKSRRAWGGGDEVIASLG